MRKYRNTPTTIDGIRFDSKAEARRYSELRLLELGKRIQDLKRQVTFALYGKNGAPICRYRADFTYSEDGKLVAEDVKGVSTPTFRIKAKLFQDNYGGDWELRVVA